MNSIKTLLWVDGYNVIFADAYLKDIAQKDVQAAVQLLVEKVADHASKEGLEPVIFFDNKNSKGPVLEEEYLGVKIISGNKDNSADTLMEKMNYLLDKKKDMVLVTSDNLIKQMVSYRTSGSRALSAQDFLIKLNNSSGKSVPSKELPAKLADILQGSAKEYFNNKRLG